MLPLHGFVDGPEVVAFPGLVLTGVSGYETKGEGWKQTLPTA